jgi:hypothetical protein
VSGTVYGIWMSIAGKTGREHVARQ